MTPPRSSRPTSTSVWMIRPTTPILVLGVIGGLIAAIRAPSRLWVVIGLWAAGHHGRVLDHPVQDAVDHPQHAAAAGAARRACGGRALAVAIARLAAPVIVAGVAVLFSGLLGDRPELQPLRRRDLQVRLRPFDPPDARPRRRDRGDGRARRDRQGDRGGDHVARLLAAAVVLARLPTCRVLRLDRRDRGGRDRVQRQPAGRARADDRGSLSRWSARTPSDRASISSCTSATTCRDSPADALPRSSLVRLLVGVAISVVFLALTLRQVDLRKVADAIGRAAPAGLAVALGIVLVDLVLRALRWYVLLRNVEEAGVRAAYRAGVRVPHARVRRQRGLACAAWRRGPGDAGGRHLPARRAWRSSGRSSSSGSVTAW